MKKERLLREYEERISRERYSLLQDFCNAYLADRLIKGLPIDLRRVTLVEKRTPEGIEYYWKYRRGKGEK